MEFYCSIGFVFNFNISVIYHAGRLKREHKREFKGALRELRKDNKYIANQRLKEQAGRDDERCVWCDECDSAYSFSFLSSERARCSRSTRR